MVRKEQAEPMKRRKAESQSAGAFRQVGALRRRYSWTGFALCLVLIALHGFLIRARGDQPASPVQLVPSTVTINSPTVNGNTTEYPTEPVRYRFPKEPKSETLLELKGNGKDWTFVQFATLPANSSLRINGHPEGYDESEEIQPEKWYWYKTKLPLVLGIKAGAQSPVNVNFWYGSPPADSHIQEKESGEMRRFTESQKITKVDITQTLTLIWDGGAVANPVKIAPNEVTLEVPESGAPPWKTVTVTGDPKLWAFVRAKQLGDFELRAMADVADNLTVPSKTLFKSDEWIGFKGTMNIDVSKRADGDPQGSKDLLLETAIAQSADQTKDTAIADIKEKKIVGSGNIKLKVSWKPVQVESWWSWSKIAIVLVVAIGIVAIAVLVIGLWQYLSGSRQERRLRERQSNKGNPLDDMGTDAHTPTYRPDGGREVDEVRDPSGRAPSTLAAKRIDRDAGSTWAGDDNALATEKIRNQQASSKTPPISYLTAKSPASPTAGPIPFDSNKLERVIDERVAPLRKELGQKTDRLEHNKLADTASALEEKLDQIEGKLGLRLEARAKLVEDLMHEQSSSMTKEVDETKRKITQVSVEGDKVKDELGNALKEMARVEERLSARYAELQSALNHQAVPDSFYAKTLGAVLGQNIEDLQEANFEKLIGERLNQFFQTGVARASDVLQDLGGRADRINGALKAVSDQMTKVNPQATDEARPNLQRAEALATDMSVLQSQLQTRRTTIETMLRVPVSMHAGARQTFLDELGRGIRREIEKLNDPEGYFEGELERLITADLIAIVDICDKKVASAPGTRPELEGALKKLFDEAGLRSIVPTRGEQFKTAEQDLIEMDQGGASLTVSQVVSRGFYYKHRGSETLLRKAGVRVYR